MNLPNHVHTLETHLNLQHQLISHKFSQNFNITHNQDDSVILSNLLEMTQNALENYEESQQ